MLVPSPIQEAAAPVTPLAMSPAHAAHYREWRILIETHMVQFAAIDDIGHVGRRGQGGREAHGRALEIIDELAARVFSVPAQTWGDVALYAEVAFWMHWSGVDPEWSEAASQLECGPMSRGKAPDAALGKLLAAIFTLAGVGPFKEAMR